MLTQLAFVAAVCCAISYGAVFDPYSRRYNSCKDSIETLLDVPSGSSSCKLISGLYALPPKSNFTITQNATFNSWVQMIETNIVKNVSISPNKKKLQMIADSFEKLNVEDSDLYKKFKYSNISTWGPVDTVTRVSTEWSFEMSLELVVATSSKGNCKLFDKLLSACSEDSEKHQALSEFIESDLKIIVKDKTKTQKDIIKAINKALKTKFFVGTTRSTWMKYFSNLKLDGYFAFSQWNSAALTFERETSYEIVLTGEGMDCPFIVSLNATLSSMDFTITQKGTIKQIMNYFIEQWKTVKTMEARLNLISMKFSEIIDASYSNFACFNKIQIQGFEGSFWDLIIFSCHKVKIPTSCGCPVPTFSDEVSTTVAAVASTTPEMMMTTEMPSTEMPSTEMSTEMPTTEMSTEGSTEFTTEASTSGSTWDSTFSSITFPSTTQGCSCSCEM